MITGPCLRTASPPICLSMASLRLARRAGRGLRSPSWRWRWRRLPARPSRSARRSPTSACSATSARKSRPSARSPGVSIGDTLETDTLDIVRERLNTAGLFADVNVWWEPHGSGVRVNISVKDKFPWAPVPTGSWSANNKAFGLLFVHGNLFGRGKQLLLGGAPRHVDSGAVARLPRSVAVRHLDLLAAAGRRAAPGVSPSTINDDLLGAIRSRSARRGLVVRRSSRRSASPGSAA